MSDITRRAMLAGATATAMATADAARAYRRIATEEGFISTGLLAQNANTRIPGIPPEMREGSQRRRRRGAADIDAGRLAAMDADGIDLRLLLLCAPGVQVFERATAVALAAGPTTVSPRPASTTPRGWRHSPRSRRETRPPPRKSLNARPTRWV